MKHDFGNRGLRAAARPARAFTLVEVLIAIGILSLVVAAIYSTWTAILKASRVGLQAAAAVQRSRIAVRVLEDSIASAQLFVANQQYYSFQVQNGNEATLSFVARLAKSFPRSGKFGDLDVRRVTFSVESGTESSRELVLRQSPLVMDLDKDEKQHPLVLAKNVREFSVELWDQRLGDWIEEWKQTNQLPKLVKVTLKLADTDSSNLALEQVVRVISVASMGVAPVWQAPRMLPVPPGGLPGQPGFLPGQQGGVPGLPGQTGFPGVQPRVQPR
jgi:type II secretion system protein J